MSKCGLESAVEFLLKIMKYIYHHIKPKHTGAILRLYQEMVFVFVIYLLFLEIIGFIYLLVMFLEVV